MIKFVFAFLVIITINSSCKTSGTMAAIEPKFGIFELPAKGEFRIWKGVPHPAFSVTLSNSSTTQSCEVYKVTDSGNEKWISPSLLAGKTFTVTIPSNGHLFIKNFNDNILKIDYKIDE
jgi:hypothetical protein